MRGFGQSRMPADAFAHHADLYALVRFLGIERAILAGASYGGGVVVSFTLEHPEMVRALVLVNASVPGQEWSEATERFAEVEEDASAWFAHAGYALPAPAT